MCVSAFCRFPTWIEKARRAAGVSFTQGWHTLNLINRKTILPSDMCNCCCRALLSSGSIAPPSARHSVTVSAILQPISVLIRMYPAVTAFPCQYNSYLYLVFCACASVLNIVTLAWWDYLHKCARMYCRHTAHLCQHGDLWLWTVNARQGQPHWDEILNTYLTHETWAINRDDCLSPALSAPTQLSLPHVYTTANKACTMTSKRFATRDTGDFYHVSVSASLVFLSWLMMPHWI